METKCPECSSTNVVKNGSDSKTGKQAFKCKDCNKYFTEGIKYEKSKSKKTNMGISIDDFRKKHDVVYILSQVFKTIQENGSDVLYEKSDIIRMANLSPGYPGIATVLDSEDFKKYRGRAGSSDYWAKPEVISELKKEGVMR